MSMGYGGAAKMIMQDEKIVIYAYYAYDFSSETSKNPERIYDGTIIIQKDALVEPEIHEKLKKMPSGRKKTIAKRIPQDVDYGALYKSGQIIVENSRFCVQFLPNGVGAIASRIVFEIFNLYQKEGSLPQEASLHV